MMIKRKFYIPEEFRPAAIASLRITGDCVSNKEKNFLVL